MKCRPYRRRYVAFRVAASASSGDLIASLHNALGEGARIKLIFHEGAYALVRIDQFALRQLTAQGMPAVFGKGERATSSVFATGSIKNARERIKAIQMRLRDGDEEAVPVNQNAKDVDSATD